MERQAGRYTFHDYAVKWRIHSYLMLPGKLCVSKRFFTDWMFEESVHCGYVYLAWLLSLRGIISVVNARCTLQNHYLFALLSGSMCNNFVSLRQNQCLSSFICILRMGNKNVSIEVKSQWFFLFLTNGDTLVIRLIFL